VRNSYRRMANRTCSLGRRRFSSYPPLGAVSTEAGAGDQDALGLVGEPIQASRGQQGVTKQVGPFFRRSITCEEEAVGRWLVCWIGRG